MISFFAKRVLIALLLFLCGFTDLLAQVNEVIIQGSIYERNKAGEEIALPDIKVVLSKKVYGFTDKEGRFKLITNDAPKYLYVFYSLKGIDTIVLNDYSKEIKIVYPYREKIKEVKITQRRLPTEISLLTPIKVEQISSKELLKAACCNLSESFETTPSVDVAITDAVTGYKQIQLLGLSGPYTLITRENIPEVRGLASITGLTFTPGQWIEGMQLSKGTGSVVNGFEGLAGQINIELRKPMEGDKQFFNLYQSTQGRTEANAYIAAEPKEGYYTNVFLHGKSQWLRTDQNHDHFIDQPLGQSFIGSNRWMIFGKNGKELQLGAKYTYQDNWGGSMHYYKEEEPKDSKYWGLKNKTNRFDAWSKLGKLYTHKRWKSMGLQLAYSQHQQNMLFGKTHYFANENTLYANYIVQTIIKNTGRVLKMGATVSNTNRNESLSVANFTINEFVSGVFSEYAHTFSPKLNAVLGARLDYHQLYKWYFTPRFHIRYAPVEQLAIRLSAGKSYRTASIFSENLGWFASNRALFGSEAMNNGIYGLQNEEGYNAGINATYKFKLNYRKGTFTTDYYFTHFINQVIVDWENPRQIQFYNSVKPTKAHSFQAQLDYELIRKFDVRLAYRFNDVQVHYASVNRTLQKPLNAMHRAFINAAYTTRSKWSFDGTLVWTGTKRIPSTLANPEGKQLPTQSPSFFTFNAHINKAFKNKLEIYLGGENLTNFMQQIAIVDSKNPFGPYFDASMIWGPSMGRNIYVGMRWKK